MKLNDYINYKFLFTIHPMLLLKKEGLLMHIGKHYEYGRLRPKLDL